MSQDKPDKKKMATSREVYDRIIWDTRLNSSAFVIGFQERLASSGVREKPLVQWATDGDIPWHRIRYIRCSGLIVWDRDQHLDLISSGELPDSAWKSDTSEAVNENAVILEFDKVPTFKVRSVYRYNSQVWQIADNALDINLNIDLNLLTIATFNVLCDMHEADKIHTAKRLPAIVKNLRQCDADIIALQEATPALLNLLLSEDWVENYYISESPTGETLQPYGNLLLSRLPFTLVEHQFSPHKRVLVGTWQINAQFLHVAVIHLPSNGAQDAVNKRREQISVVLGHLQTLTGDSLIVGDFNIRGHEQQEILKSSGFVDVWQKLHPYEPGYTFDTELNPLAALISLSGKPARFDRILLRSSNHSWTPKLIEFFAKEAIPGTGEVLYPSDHFGVRATLEFSIVEFSTTQFSTKTLTKTALENLSTVKPIYQSAIVLIPPESAFGAIQAIRRRFDSKFQRWMPHITLIYGFVPEEYFSEAVEIINPVLAQLEPFKLTLKEFATFAHRKNSTVWLRPITEPETALHELQALLQKLFPQCNEQSRKSEVGFTPHLSVGQFPSKEEAIIQLPQWHPINFTVDSVALISRRGDQPFEVRYTIPLGNTPVETLHVTSLHYVVNNLEPELTTEQKIQRETVIEIVTQACAECLSFQPSLNLLGSARLGVQSPESDLDVVCLIPAYLSGETFLFNVQQRLQGLCDIAQVILDARVPVLQLKLEGISLDLLYAVSTESGNIADFDPVSRKAIVGCWEADLIKDVISKSSVNFDSFRWLLRAVKAWAKSRKIYGNSWGFIGGFSWALLSAWSCSCYEELDNNLEKLLTHFFQILNEHDWSQTIAISEAGKQYKAKLPRDWLPIITSIEPCQNSARNVSRSTAKILRQEFTRGAMLTQEILTGKMDWDSLFEPVNFGEQSNICLVITAISQDDEALEKYCGLLEGYTIGLVIQLEQQFDIFVRPWTGIQKTHNTARVVLGLNLANGCDYGSVQRLGEDFWSQFSSDGVSLNVVVCDILN
ncbi:MAG: DUF504 domain-containing protein [Scytonematopsis contorta HA4267-MV1]|jgi:poly(A) polymerase|nr:DUF504 domain-containing protein [Scytonematopsis contorta HA4267-MV1]